MPIIRMEKSSLRTIIGKALSYSTPTKRQVARSAACLSCPEGSRHRRLEEECHALMSAACPDIGRIRSAKNEMEAIDRMCSMSGCSRCQVRKVYQNDRKDYRMHVGQGSPSGRRIPKHAIRLFLLLYSLPQSMLGDAHFIRDLSAAKAAEYLSCTVPTVRRSMETLQSSGYLTFSHASDLLHFNVMLTHYDTMHLPAAKGGCGYLTFGKGMLDALLAAKNVNQLRLEILCLLRYDNAQRKCPEGGSPLWESYSFKDLKNMLPPHMNYRAKFERILGSPDAIFNHCITGSRVYFSLKESFPLRFDYESLASDSYDSMRGHFTEHGIQIGENDLASLSKMATQYDVPLILRCTRTALCQYRGGASIQNLPGLVRTLCQKIALGNQPAV